MNDFIREYHFLKEELNVSIQNTLESGWYILGKECDSFERAVEKFCNVKHAIGVGNGYDALCLILRSLNIGEGDEVITTPNTAFATTLAILSVGATPVFGDVDIRSGWMSPACIPELITEKTKAILPVDIYGSLEYIQQIKDIAVSYNLFLIEDACQAFGAKRNARYAGTFGIAGAYSFYPTKNLGGLGDGGMVVTDDEHIASKIMMLRNYGQSERYYHPELGINSRLDELQASVLKVKLNHIEQFNKRRIEIAGLFNEKINSAYFQKPPYIDDGSSIFHLYVMTSSYRKQLIDYLKSNGIVSLIHYPVPAYSQKVIKDDQISLPVEEQFSSTCFSIPIHPFLRDEEIDRIITVLNTFTPN